jgi:hypothetical protein
MIEIFIKDPDVVVVGIADYYVAATLGKRSRNGSNFNLVFPAEKIDSADFRGQDCSHKLLRAFCKALAD